MRYWLVMPAAGAGRRFGTPLPKQYARLEGRTVIEWSLAPFLADRRCAGAVVALAADDGHWAGVAPRLQAPAPGNPSPPQVPAVNVVVGGAQRSHSVRGALAALEQRAEADDWVLVHDAVRPCLDAADLERLLATLAAHPLGGLLAVPAADTLKRAAPAARDADPTTAATPAPPAAPAVAETVERARLWRALTPQMFRYGRLCAALDEAHAAGRSPTDEAQALEWQGGQPLLVEGAASNLKVTTAADLVLAAAVLRARTQDGS
jgi:2-C-methyl-D-erythritol 4-phosphate cytidylyltransferase